LISTSANRTNGNSGSPTKIIESKRRPKPQWKTTRWLDYALTPEGMNLFPEVMAVIAQGDRCSSGAVGPLIELHHKVCGQKNRTGTVCSACGEPRKHDTISAGVTEAYK
jgi:hypothetical protein